MAEHNSEILGKLNEAQLQAVTAPLDSNLLVLAGAGSGKTRVLIHRIWWLLRQGINYNNIFSVTFTNKAAGEMRERLLEMLNVDLQRMWIGTFHSLAHRFLRLHWQEAELPMSFQVIDADDQYRLLRRIHKTFNLDEEKWPIKQSQNFINNSKDKCLRGDKISAHHLADATSTKIYCAYEDICKQSGLVDFSELLLLSYEVLLRNQELLAHYKQRFTHILVDEFQDTNSIQYMWIQLLTKGSANFMAVGDDDQSIYSWRGANAQNMQQLSLDFPDTKIIRLEQNYRSTANILTAANAVIANNTGRLGKNLWTSGKKGSLLHLYTAFNEIDEARYIGFSIQNYLDKGYKYSDIAVLYRSNAQSRVLEGQLTQSQIPYIIYGGLRFYDRAEIKDVLAYLRLTINKNDAAAFERIINVPTRGVGDVTLIALRDFASAKQISLWHAAKDMLAANMFNTRAKNAISSFISIIENIEQQIDILEMPELISFAAKISGLRAHLEKDKTHIGKGRLENIDELISAAQQFVLLNVADSNVDLLSLFLAHIFLEATEETGQKYDANNSVRLMTLHSAKGLEFPLVFICGLEEGLFPHMMSMSSPEEIEEERRLCYVGMTRAMSELHLVHADSRQIYGTSSFRRPSRFLKEIPENLLEKKGAITHVYKSYEKSSDASIAGPVFQNEDGQFKIGQKVFHNKFGEGIIINLEGDGASKTVQVKFVRHGTKLLAFSVAKLQII